MHDETVDWAEKDLYEWDGEMIAVILQVEHPNLTFRFGVPRSHNNIPGAEAAFIQVHHKELGRTDVTYLDKSEIINYQLGLALIVDDVFRERDSVVSREVSDNSKAQSSESELGPSAS